MTVSKHFREGPCSAESRSILLRVESEGGERWGHRKDFKITVEQIQEDFGWQKCSVVKNTKSFYNLQKSLKERHEIISTLPHKLLMKIFGSQRKLIILSNFLTKIILSSDLRTNQACDIFKAKTFAIVDHILFFLQATLRFLKTSLPT